MAATITFGGIGSGMDVEGIITGLTNATRAATVTPLQTRSTQTKAASSDLSKVSTLLATLQTAAQALDTAREASSYTAKSSGAAVVASATGAALPGSYDVSVESLATEQRTYSNAFSSNTDALGQSGTLSFSIGGGSAVNIDVTSSDSLTTIADKINAEDVRASASVLYDGSQYRLQIRGLDTGADNAIAFTETGTSLGLDVASNTIQQAADAVLDVDTFQVTRPTNQVVGVIPGVTLALTDTTSSPIKVSVETDPDGLASRLNDFVKAYNGVVDKVHGLAGFGTQKASDTVLAGDATLRGITNRLSTLFMNGVSGTAGFESLTTLGLSVGRDGKMTLDSTKLKDALSNDPASAAEALGGTSAVGGFMDDIVSFVKDVTDPSDGSLAVRQQGLDAQAKRYDDKIATENDRLDQYAESLRKQFTAMDSTVAQYNNQLAYLQKITG